MDFGQVLIDGMRSSVGVPAAAYALAAIGLNLHFGYTGLLNFGQVGFMMVGAYGAAVTVHQGGSIWLGILVGVLAAVTLGVLIGIPTLRLRADYLAIVTIAASEIFRLMVSAPSWRAVTGGSDGLSGFSSGFYDLNPTPDGTYGFGPWRYSERTLYVLVVGWVLVLLATLLVALLIRSPWGRVIKAIREDEDAVRSLGKNVYGYKMQSLILGGVIGAVGGMFWVLAQAAITPGSFSPIPTFYAYAALILGGMARIWGPVVGSMIFWALLSFSQGFINELVANEYIPRSIMDSNQAGNVRFMLVGLGLMLLLIFRPQGIFGDKREIALQDR
jgi:branched-chain amino acid transport system permease protein